MRGPHEPSLADNVIANFSAEAKGKMSQIWAHLVLYGVTTFRNTPQVQGIQNDLGSIIFIETYTKRTCPVSE